MAKNVKVESYKYKLDNELAEAYHAGRDVNKWYLEACYRLTKEFEPSEQDLIFKYLLGLINGFNLAFKLQRQRNSIK
jgi:hypothetical protein